MGKQLMVDESSGRRAIDEIEIVVELGGLPDVVGRAPFDCGSR
jgi:hypothetical protein